MKDKIKSLDALKLKEAAQTTVLRETAGLSTADEIAYYRKSSRNGRFADLLSRLRKKANSRR
jgi:hypothetical protein